jgi:sialate O-acetylesterase
MDIGDVADIHPKNKQEVGRRLALWALAKDYGREVVYSGPLFKESISENGSMRLKFDHAGSGLSTRDGGPLTHFEIAGGDQVFHPATAVIAGTDVIVSSGSVPTPEAVRYGFSSQAEPNLMNQQGLPASSFRTDRW